MTSLGVSRWLRSKRLILPALDPRTQLWLTELIEQLSAAGKTIVMATHDLESLPRIADRCVVFDETHRIVADGPPAEVLARRELLLSVNLIHERTVLPPML